MNLKQKLTSRKFWASLVAFATSLIVAFKVECITAEQLTLILSGIGSLICYIFSEGSVDKGNIKPIETDLVKAETVNNSVEVKSDGGK